MTANLSTMRRLTNSPMPLMDKQEIIFADNNILIFNKQPGVALQSKGENLMESQFSEYKVLNRLDQPVSGACLLAKTSEAAGKLGSAIIAQRVKKTYIAIVEGKLAVNSGVVNHKLSKSRNQKAIVAEEGKEAEMYYEVLRELDNYSILKVKINTGRFHQIRAQLSALGHPVKGDLKYGSKRSNKHPGIYLHCRQIAFVHPISNNMMTLKANFPKMGLWSLLEDLDE